MTAKSLEICNLKGITDFKVDVGTFLLLSGANASGKTSIIDSVLAIFQGGVDAGWLRRGEPKGYVRLVLEDDAGRPISIEKTIYKSKKGGEIKATLEIIGPDSPEPIPAPQSFINRLADSLAVNPCAFLGLKAKEAADELLKVLPIAFDRDRVQQIAVVPVEMTDPLTLPQLRSLTDGLYSQRKKANADFKQFDASAKTFRQSLPGADDSPDWTAEVTALEARAQEVQELRRKEKDAARANAMMKERQILEDINLRMTALGDERARRKAALAKEEETALLKVEAMAAPVLSEITTALATAKEKARAQERAAGARNEIKRLDAQAAAAAGQSDRLTHAMEKLKEMETAALAELPIPGLSYDGEQFFVDGIPVPHMNHAAQIDLALQIRVLRGGELKMFVIDGCEALDDEGMAALRAGAAKLGYQVIAAEVSDVSLRAENIPRCRRCDAVIEWKLDAADKWFALNPDGGSHLVTCLRRKVTA